MATMAKDDHHHRSVCVTELTRTLCATSCVCATLVEDNVKILGQQAKERTLVSSHCNMHCGAHCTRTQSKRMFCNALQLALDSARFEFTLKMRLNSFALHDRDLSAAAHAPLSSALCFYHKSERLSPIETPSNGDRDFHPYRGGKNPYRGGAPWFRWRRLFSIVYITKHPPHHLHYIIINRRISHTTLYVHYKV